MCLFEYLKICATFMVSNHIQSGTKGGCHYLVTSPLTVILFVSYNLLDVLVLHLAVLESPLHLH